MVVHHKNFWQGRVHRSHPRRLARGNASHLSRIVTLARSRNEWLQHGFHLDASFAENVARVWPACGRECHSGFERSVTKHPAWATFQQHATRSFEFVYRAIWRGNDAKVIP